MKNINTYLLLLLLIFTNSETILAQCPPDGINFYNQSTVNSFPQDYPDCTSITGDVLISGNVNNLDSLYPITEIQGSVDLVATAFLDDIEGLISLETIGGDLYIHTNSTTPELIFLTGLNNLSTIGGSLRIQGVKSILNLSGLENLTTVGGSFSLIANDEMLNMSGLNSLTTIADSFVVKLQDKITDINLASLSFVGGSFRIASNPRLVNVMADDTYVEGSIVIGQNNDMVNLSAFNNTDTLPGLFSVFTNYELSNLNVLTNTKHINGNFNLRGNLLEDVNCLQNLNSIDGDFLMGYSSQLNNLSGLANLNAVNGDFTFDNFPALTTLIYLDSLESINGTLKIQNLPAMPSLIGLHNLDYTTIANLELKFCDNLAYCSLANICTYLDQGGPATIQGGASGCSSVAEIENSCTLAYEDLDGDGFSVLFDCDDSDPSIYPNADEIINNDIDEDCDGVAQVIDEDNDGYNSVEDCDETNANINPNGIEIPNNNIDEDCDGEDLVLVQGGNQAWCFQSIMADDFITENVNDAVITTDDILYIADQLDGIARYDLDNNYLGDWNINGSPVSLAIDSEENFYVGLNSGTNLVEKYDKDGVLLQTFEEWGEANDLHIDEQFNLYVANQPTDEILVYDMDGNLINSWTVDLNNGPTMLTMDSEGFVYVGSIDYVEKYFSDGTPVNGWSIVSPGGPNDFYGMEFNPADNSLYILSSFAANDKVFVYDTDGNLVEEISVGISWGTGISFSYDQKMILSDWSAENVKIYAREFFDFDFDITAPTCSGNSNGSLEITAYNGCGSLSYELASSDPLDQLSEGNYTLIITSPNNDTSHYEFEIIAPDPLGVTYTSNDASSGVNDGAISLMVSGGTMEYTYLWDDFFSSTSPELTDLNPGVYTVTITDANNCSIQEAITVGGIGGLVDLDGDGFYSDVDCNDEDAAINPDAVEIPNNDIDENCDDIAQIIDADNDGFNSDEDCDDNDPAINPDAIEIPNNDVDEDCDDIAQMIDEDNDGYNSEEDCDDANPDVNPGAVEIINNGIDEDCIDGDLLIETSGYEFCFESLLGTDNNTLEPYDAEISSDGIIFVANAGDGIAMYDLDNNYLGGWSTSGNVRAMSMDSDENIYIGTQNGNNFIEKYDKEGNLLQTFDAPGSTASDIYINDQFIVYVADPTSSSILVFNPQGDLINSWIYDGGINTQPLQVTGDNEGFIYVGGQNGALQKFTSDGNILADWGLGFPPGQASTVYFNRGLEFNPLDSAIYLLRVLNTAPNGPAYVHAFTKEGSFIYGLDVDLETGLGLSISEDQKLLISDTGADDLKMYKRNLLSFDYAVHPVSCPGGNDGRLELLINGGCSDTLIVNLESNDPFDQLSMGSYNLIAIYPSGDTTVVSFEVTEVAPMLVTYTTEDASDGINDGTISLTVSGGTADYSYDWNDVNNGDTIMATNLAPGEYVVTITDANGCTIEEAITVGGIGGEFDLDNDGFPESEDCDETNPDINPDAVEIPDNGIDEDCDGEDLITSLATIQGVSVRVFPNPVKGNLMLEWDGVYFPEVRIRLYNSAGVLVFSSVAHRKLMQIDVSSFVSGLYILEIRDFASGDGIIEKVVVE